MQSSRFIGLLLYSTRALMAKPAINDHDGRLFVEAYFQNNRNATAAYLAIRPKAKRSTAGAEGHKVLKIPEIKGEIKAREAELLQQSRFSTERVLEELARIAYLDPAKLFDDQGKLIPVRDMDEDTRRAIASIDNDELFDNEDGERRMAGFTRKLRVHSKVSAIAELIKLLPPRQTPTPGDPGTVTHFHVDVPWKDLRKKAAK